MEPKPQRTAEVPTACRVPMDWLVAATTTAPAVIAKVVMQAKYAPHQPSAMTTPTAKKPTRTVVDPMQQTMASVAWLVSRVWSTATAVNAKTAAAPQTTSRLKATVKPCSARLRNASWQKMLRVAVRLTSERIALQDTAIAPATNQSARGHLL